MAPPSWRPTPPAPACWPAAARVPGGSCLRAPLRLLPLSRPRNAVSSSLRQIPGSARPHDAATSRLHPDASAWPWSPAPPWALARLHLPAVALPHVPPYSGSAGVAFGRRHHFTRHVDDWKWVTAGGATASPEEMFWHMFVLLAWGLFFLATTLVWSMVRLNILRRILGLLKMLCYKWVTAGGAAASPELTLRIFHLRRFKLNLLEMFWHMFVLLGWGLFFLATIFGYAFCRCYYIV